MWPGRLTTGHAEIWWDGRRIVNSTGSFPYHQHWVIPLAPAAAPPRGKAGRAHAHRVTPFMFL